MLSSEAYLQRRHHLLQRKDLVLELLDGLGGGRGQLLEGGPSGCHLALEHGNLQRTWGYHSLVTGKDSSQTVDRTGPLILKDLHHARDQPTSAVCMYARK